MEIVQRKQIKKWVIVFIFLGMVTFIILNITGILEKEQKVAPKMKFYEVKEAIIHDTKLISGQVTNAKVESIYYDPSKGRVKNIFVKKGQKVHKGDKILQYSNEELNVQLQQSEIDQKLNSLKYNNLIQNINRIQKKINKTKKELSENDPTVHSLEEQVEELEQQKEIMNLEIEKTKIQINELMQKQKNLTVHSKFDGYIQNVNGQVVTNSDNSTTPLLKIIGNDSYIIEGYLSELQREQVKPNQSVSVTAKAIPGKTWNGKVIDIEDSPITGSANNQVVMDQEPSNTISYYLFKSKLESDEGLLPGYHVAIQINVSSEKVLVVPRSSVRNENNSTYVYVKHNNKIVKRKIITGDGDEERTAVTSGLKIGDKVVIKPSDNIKSGMEVK